MTTTFTPYSAWPELETLAHTHGSTLAPEWFLSIQERAEENGERPTQVLARMAHNAGLNVGDVLSQYHCFMDGMRRLFARR